MLAILKLVLLLSKHEQNVLARAYRDVVTLSSECIKISKNTNISNVVACQVVL